MKLLERNRANVVSKDDINKLEDKIKDLEDQIFNAKKKGEEQKLDKLEDNLNKTSLIDQHLQLMRGEIDDLLYDDSEEDKAKP